MKSSVESCETVGELMEYWQSAYSFNNFIADGIIKSETYETPHIVFVLRDKNGGTDSLCDALLTEGGGYKTWNNVARWTRALLDGDDEYPKIITKEERIKQLKRVCAINLKKEAGVPRTKWRELKSAVEEQHAEILREIELCEPDIIICGGLGNAALMKSAVFGGACAESEFSVCSTVDGRAWSGYYIEINGKNVPVIGFCHPQTTVLGGRRGHEDLFKPLFNDMRAIRRRFIEKIK